MEFQNLIEKRRSIRKYSAEGSVSREDLMEMIRAAQEAPSWKNSQTGRYYCLTSEEMTSRFRSTCLPEGNALKTQNAALIVTTFVRNRSGFQKDGTPDNELGNGWGCYDLGLQNATLLLKAQDMGYGTLVIGLRDADSIRDLLSIPEEEIITAVIAVGIPAEEPARPKRKETSDIVKFF
nr:nitroreductase family protein [uncultured Blautia sp.]